MTEKHGVNMLTQYFQAENARGICLPCAIDRSLPRKIVPITEYLWYQSEWKKSSRQLNRFETVVNELVDRTDAFEVFDKPTHISSPSSTQNYMLMKMEMEKWIPLLILNGHCYVLKEISPDNENVILQNSTDLTPPYPYNWDRLYKKYLSKWDSKILLIKESI